MFSVLFEVLPRPDQWDAYLGYAKMLRPELEQVDGFVDNIRYRSLTREGWILSLSNWRDEKSVVRWRTKMRHHEVQEKGRHEVLRDYHLRVGQITGDSHIPPGYELVEQRLDETEVGEGTAVLLIDAKRPAQWNETSHPAECAAWLGLQPFEGLESWEIFEAVFTPGDLILMVSLNRQSTAKSFEDSASFPQGARIRRVRVIRDYTMHDRREAPQYYAEVP
jgi:heme-degrading monooxygenase HmoA